MHVCRLPSMYLLITMVTSTHELDADECKCNGKCRAKQMGAGSAPKGSMGSDH